MNALASRWPRGAGTAGGRPTQARRRLRDRELRWHRPLSAWFSALGGLALCWATAMRPPSPTIWAAPRRHRLSPRPAFLVAWRRLHARHPMGEHFMGQGWSDSVSVAPMCSFTQSNFYVDALAGYAYFQQSTPGPDPDPGLQQRNRHGQHRRQPVSSARSRAATSSASMPPRLDYHAVGRSRSPA